MDDASQVAARDEFLHGHQDGRIPVGLGDEYIRQLGDGTNETRLTPVKVMDGVKQVALGQQSPSL